MEHLVDRKDSDLEWLYNVLTNENPGCIIPPLPEKTKDMGESIIFLG